MLFVDLLQCVYLLCIVGECFVAVRIQLDVVLTACEFGGFGANCDKRCHCANTSDDCQTMKGHCKSGCAGHFSGFACQGNALCTVNIYHIRI